MTATMRERTEGRYEVRRVPYGKVYERGPGGVLVGCECGQLMIAEDDTATCPRCGANYTDVLGELVGKHREPKDEEARPGYREYLFSGLFSGLKVKDEINRLLDKLYDS